MRRRGLGDHGELAQRQPLVPQRARSATDLERQAAIAARGRKRRAIALGAVPIELRITGQAAPHHENRIGEVAVIVDVDIAVEAAVDGADERVEPRLDPVPAGIIERVAHNPVSDDRRQERPLEGEIGIVLRLGLAERVRLGEAEEQHPGVGARFRVTGQRAAAEHHDGPGEILRALVAAIAFRRLEAGNRRHPHPGRIARDGEARRTRARKAGAREHLGARRDVEEADALARLRGCGKHCEDRE